MISIKDIELPPQLIDSDEEFSLYTRCMYKNEYIGISYDPDNHISIIDNLEQEIWRLTDIDADFALYLNYPIYKRDIIDFNTEYFENTLDDRDLSSNSVLRYTKTLFDLSTPDNYTKLANPIPNKYDGFIKIKKRSEE